MAKGNRFRQPRRRKPLRRPRANTNVRHTSAELAEAAADPESKRSRDVVESLSDEQIKAIIDRLPPGMVEVAESLAGGLPSDKDEADDATGHVEQEAVEFARLAKAGGKLPKKARARLRRAALYPHYPIGAEERNEVNEILEAMQAMDVFTETGEYQQLVVGAKLMTSRWKLTVTESAQLLNVEESAWTSGEWINMLNPERAFRIMIVSNVLQWMENLLGEELAMRWLRQPDHHAIFGGVVPIEELGQQDLTRLRLYSIFVKKLYAPEQEWTH